MNIKENLETIKSGLPQNVTLVAVTKTKPNADVLVAYEAGHRDFGENKVQDMVEKYETLPKDINWHMIGHVQTNKVKYMAEFVHLIHSVDRLKVLKEINKQAKIHERTINCLLQIKIAEEDSKFGLSVNDAEKLIKSDEFKNLENINIVGLMGMATFTDDDAQINKEFKRLKLVFDKFQPKYLPNFNLETISMGMSGDYEIALKNGTTMIRVGSSIFGNRNY